MSQLCHGSWEPCHTFPAERAQRRKHETRLTLTLVQVAVRLVRRLLPEPAVR